MADDPTRFVEEFLYRGREPGSAETPAWHVTIGWPQRDPVTGKRAPPLLKQFNMADAIAAGFTLSGIVEELNLEAIAAYQRERSAHLQTTEAVRTAITSKEAEFEAIAVSRDAAMQEIIAGHEKAIDEVRASFNDQIEKLTARHKAEMAAKDAEHAAICEQHKGVIDELTARHNAATEQLQQLVMAKHAELTAAQKNGEQAANELKKARRELERARAARASHGPTRPSKKET
ncbi:MAG: hypothetical protein AB7O04_15835 [Hyphomonadaceae bacterium]